MQVLQGSGEMGIRFYTLPKKDKVAWPDAHSGCGGQPIGNLLCQPRPRTTIEHQVNPRMSASIHNSMRSRQVEEPALARRHRNDLPIQEEVHARRAEQRHVQAQVGVRPVQVIVAMFVDAPAGPEPQQPGRDDLQGPVAQRLMPTAIR